MLFSRIRALLPEGIVDDLYITTQGATITSIGKDCPTGDFGRVMDGHNRLMLPGFVNAHGHTAMTLLRGYGENLTLHDWLHQRVFPFEAHLTPEDVYWGTLLGIAEMLRFGVTSTDDMYFFLDAMGRAYLESGFKANITNAAVNLDQSPFASLSSTKETIAALAWANERVRVDGSIHAEYTSDENTVRAVAEQALTNGLRVQVHLSETEKEHEEAKPRRNGRTAARYLADCGLFDAPTTVAHGVWLEPQDFALLHEKGATIATCPCSNMKLASGAFNAKMAKVHDVPFAIATDGAASNNNLNMMEEMRLFALLSKGSAKDPTLITPKEALYAATRAGALAQGRGDCGQIAVGAKADLCLLDLDVPHMHPVHDLATSVVYSAMGSDVVMTVVDGQVLYENGQYPTLDVERIMHQADRAQLRILSQI